MYKDTFVIDDITFRDRKAIKETSSEYLLNNFNYYLPKLEKDFYLRVFIKKSLFDIDIFELDDFLTFQYENSKNKEKFIKALTLKVIPSIENIIKNANFSLEGGGAYYNQITLEDDFVESEGVIKNRDYEFSMFFHRVAAEQLEEDITQRKLVVSNFIQSVEATEIDLKFSPLKWRGKPTHLAFLIGQLIEEGYLDAPTKNDNEINYTELSRILLKTFSFQKAPSTETLRRYLNINDDKHKDLKEGFNNVGYHLPNSGILG